MIEERTQRTQPGRNKKEVILWIIIIVLAALLIVAIWCNLKISDNNKDISAKTKMEQTQAFVNDVEQRRYRYPAIDVKDNRVYIPEMKIFLPLSENSRDIRYQVRGGTLWLSTAMAVGRQTGEDDASCDRVVLLTQSENDGRGYIAAGTIESQDSSVRYIFRHPACKIYNDTLSKNLADVTKELQYY